MQAPNILTIEKIGTIVIPGRVPSINEYIAEMNKHRQAGNRFEQEWKEVGFLAAKQFINNQTFFAPLSSGIWLGIKVFRLNASRKRDVHNLFVKPIFDGFTCAGLWDDDNEKVIPKVTFEYCGVDRENPRVEFWIYQETEGL